MVPSPTDFGFGAEVPASGFRWVTQSELQVVWADRRDSVHGYPLEAPGQPGSLGPVLVSAVKKGDPPGEDVFRNPCRDNRALFQEFAALDATSLDDALAFANEHGDLGFQTPVHCALTGGGDVWLVNECPDPAGRPGVLLFGEMHADWVHSVARMRVAVNVLAALRQGGRGVGAKSLSGIFRWRAPEPGDILIGREGGWILDTHPDLPKISDENLFGRDTARIRERVFMGAAPSRYEDVAAVARTWLVREVNQQLHGRASPKLRIGDDGAFAEELEPMTLLTAMWAQVYGAITGNKSYEQCKGCARWFEVSGARGARTVRAVYCVDACRVRSYRSRRDRAEQLASEGLSAAAVVARMRGEGHDSDVATVKKWIGRTAKHRRK